MTAPAVGLINGGFATLSLRDHHPLIDPAEPAIPDLGNLPATLLPSAARDGGVLPGSLTQMLLARSWSGSNARNPT